MTNNWKPEPGKPAMTRDGRMVDDLAIFQGVFHSAKHKLVWWMDGSWAGHVTGELRGSSEDHPFDLVAPWRVEPVYDKRGIPIERGDLVKVFHFREANGKRHYMYKQCLGVASYPHGEAEYVFFSHLNFNNEIGSRDGPYHEWPGTHLPHYEIINSSKCDHGQRPRTKAENGNPIQGVYQNNK